MRALLMTVSTLVVLVACAPADAATRACGSIFQEGVSPEKVSATGESCKAARALAREVSKGTVAGGCMSVGRGGFTVARPCVRRGYTCRALRRLGDDASGVRVSCRRSARVVKWDVR